MAFESRGNTRFCAAAQEKGFWCKEIETKCRGNSVQVSRLPQLLFQTRMQNLQDSALLFGDLNSPVSPSWERRVWAVKRIIPRDSRTFEPLYTRERSFGELEEQTSQALVSLRVKKRKRKRKKCLHTYSLASPRSPLKECFPIGWFLFPSFTYFDSLPPHFFPPFKHTHTDTHEHFSLGFLVLPAEPMLNAFPFLELIFESWKASSTVSAHTGRN